MPIPSRCLLEDVRAKRHKWAIRRVRVFSCESQHPLGACPSNVCKDAILKFYCPIWESGAAILSMMPVQVTHSFVLAITRTGSRRTLQYSAFWPPLTVIANALRCCSRKTASRPLRVEPCRPAADVAPCTKLHAKAKSVSGLHLCLYARPRPTSCRSGPAAALRGQSAIRPPNGVAAPECRCRLQVRTRLPVALCPQALGQIVRAGKCLGMLLA
jgi:hypothetical protein